METIVSYYENTWLVPTILIVDLDWNTYAPK